MEMLNLFDTSLTFFFLFSVSTISHIPAFKFDALLPYDKTKFFRYNGSLTTPTCNEAVTWTVFNDAVKISQYQVQ